MGCRNTVNNEVAMKLKNRRSHRCTRSKLYSPGRPPVWQRENLCRFWQAIASGRTSEDAGVEAGVSAPVGVRWFRRAGGMPPTNLAPSAKPMSGRYLTFQEREDMALELAKGRRDSGHCAQARSVTKLDLSGGTPQRCDARRQSRLQSKHRAMAC